MKKLFTLSMALLSLSAVVAQPKSADYEQYLLTPAEVQEVVALRKAAKVKKAPFKSNLNVATPAEAVSSFNMPLLDGAAAIQVEKVPSIQLLNKTFDQENAPAMKPQRVAAAHNTAHYDLGEGVYRMGWTTNLNSFSAPLLSMQAFSPTPTFLAKKGNTWKINGNTVSATNDLGALLDANNNICYGSLGIVTWYTPTIYNGTYSYFYGSEGKNSYSGINIASLAESNPLGMYNMYDCNLYVGWGGGQYAYGSGKELNGDNQYESSNTVLVDFGKPAGGCLVLNSVFFPAISKTNPLAKGATLQAVLVEYADDNMTTVLNTFNAVFTSDNFFFGGQLDGGMKIYAAEATFVAKDADGFEEDVIPVINNPFRLYVTGFQETGVDCGIPMTYDQTAKQEIDGSITVSYPSHTYFDLYVDGQLQVGSTGAAKFYQYAYTDAILAVNGYYNYLGGLAGEKVVTGEAPVEGGIAVTAVENGQKYNDYGVQSTFGASKLGIVSGPDWAELAIDTTYYKDYSTLIFYIGAAALPSGVEGRVGDFVLMSEDMAASVTLRVTQGKVSTGIDGVTTSVAFKAVAEGEMINVTCPAEVKEVSLYNAAGLLLGKTPVVNGKAQMQGAKGLNIVSFDGANAVKVIL